MLEQTKTEPETTFKAEKKGISIITLYDNYLSNPELKTDWGFSCLVKTETQNILFDTGADSEILLFNIERKSISPEEIDIVFLSHNHFDHVGGLNGFLKVNENKAKIYQPTAFSEPAKILNNIYSTGALGTFIKEQSLVLNTKKGLVIITGCAHPGVINIIKKAKEMWKVGGWGAEENIYLVLGGFHLSGAGDSELRSIVNDFRKLGVQKVAPCHCSGDRCRELFKEEYGDDFIENGAGRIIEI